MVQEPDICRLMNPEAFVHGERPDSCGDYVQGRVGQLLQSSCLCGSEVSVSENSGNMGWRAMKLMSDNGQAVRSVLLALLLTCVADEALHWSIERRYC